jgi:hypothetical protein
MKGLLVAMVCVLCVVPAFAKAADELTFSASLFNPNQGPTTWAGNGEYLIGVSNNVLIGPSVGLFDLGETDGGQVGVAGKVRIGKKSGLFVGGALHKLTGDAADAADYTADARAGLDFGGEKGFVTVYAQQTWAQNDAGDRTSPEGTSVVAGVGLRF